jgi:hypothetical protein
MDDFYKNPKVKKPQDQKITKHIKKLVGYEPLLADGVKLDLEAVSKEYGLPLEEVQKTYEQTKTPKEPQPQQQIPGDFDLEGYAKSQGIDFKALQEFVQSQKQTQIPTMPKPTPLEMAEGSVDMEEIENSIDAEQEEMDVMEEETNPLYTMLMGDDESAPVSIKNIYAVNESTVEGVFPNGLQFYVRDTGDELEFMTEEDEEASTFSYEDITEMFDFMNLLGKE